MMSFVQTRNSTSSKLEVQVLCMAASIVLCRGWLQPAGWALGPRIVTQVLLIRQISCCPTMSAPLLTDYTVLRESPFCCNMTES